MSVVYEPRNFIHDGSYPPIDDHHHDVTADVDRFTDPSDAVVNELASTVATFSSAPPPPFVDTTEPRLELPVPTSATATVSSPKEDSPPLLTPLRIKAIPKPDREVTRNLLGKFICTWAGCAEEPKEFNRKCEWNKHMDKHDRPYKCAAAGCQKLPGFTYSGGLLRHEREVHGKHGGPKNSFFCPHPNCKRHAGKGFSRQENLNEHLRRVHTTPQNGGAPASLLPGVGTANEGADTDDGASDNALTTTATANGAPKRKRNADEDDDTGAGGDLREEIKRVRMENEELRRQVQAQNQQTVVMMQKISQLQQALETRLGGGVPVPTAAAVGAGVGVGGVGVVVPQAPMATASMI